MASLAWLIRSTERQRWVCFIQPQFIKLFIEGVGTKQMHALFKPKAQSGQNPFIRKKGKIYFRKILLVPQPLDHKKDRE